MEPSSRITVNGVEYTSWEQMPPEVRAALSKALPDLDGDGVPDLLRGGDALGALSGLSQGEVTSTSVTASYTVDGSTYPSAADLPEAVRRKLEQAGVLPVGETSATGEGAAPSPRPTLLNGEPFDPTMPQRKRRWWHLGR